MGAAFKARYRRNKETLEWYDALAMAVAIIALVFTFGVRIVKVDGHSMEHTLSDGERILINLLKAPDYGDIVVVDGYTDYGKPLVKRVIGMGGDTIDIWVLDPDFSIVESARAGATGYSFPSGHTQNAFSSFGCLGMWAKGGWRALCFCHCRSHRLFADVSGRYTRRWTWAWPLCWGLC